MNQMMQKQKPSAARNTRNGLLRNYLVGAVIVWVALIVAASLILAGTPYFAQLLPILGGGAAWFVVIVPGLLLGRREKTEA
jgi:hypothetical protein